MRILGLLLLGVFVAPTAIAAQMPDAAEGTRIQSTQVSGIDIDRISPGLRRDIDALVGTPLSWTAVKSLASRIEQERPGFAASVRAIPSGDEARVVFFVARLQDDRRLEENINARYTVESAHVEGLPEQGISPSLQADIQALVGTSVDHDALEKLATRLRGELPGYDVDRKMKRGTRRGQLDVEFTIRKGEDLRWLHFVPSQSKFLYHSEQGWSGLLTPLIGDRDWRVTPMLALDNRDDLVEEYSGFGVRVESRKIGTDRLGVSFEMSWLEQTWQDATLAALAATPAIPEAYRDRTTVAPSAVFAITSHLRVGGGVSINELESLSRSPASQTANAAVVLLGYDQEWKRTGWTQRVETLFDVRRGVDALQSDLLYTRYFGRARYEYERGSSVVIASGMAGRITSDANQAPLFERFTLGDSSTLRGWNKYDIAPVGGEYMFHASTEYRHRGLAFFFDLGSLWDRDTASHVRTSAGVGYHLDNVFFTLGFPINTDDVDAMFMAGVRF
jgi:hypothetical protein